ncbi:bacteriocin immunity protein [Pseudomonas sp. NPDC089554]|uniref:bacteriocin immunity protein n=1 Tax=Pseudomonas sp. NPDC089554 TaxID=3390653 RepID=UPI003D01F6E7
MIDLKRTFTDYTADEFKSLVTVLTGASGSSAEQDQLLEHFIELTCHPSGSDLIYHPASGRQETSEQILERITQWRESMTLQCFPSPNSPIGTRA